MTDNAALERQEMALLHRIASGDNLANASDMDRRLAHRLVPRGLARVALHAATRGYALTARGRALINSPPPRPIHTARPQPTAEQARTLIEQIADAHGTLRVPDPDDRDRAAYLRLIRAVKRHGVIPSGRRLLYTGRDRGDLILYLAHDPDTGTQWNRTRLTERQHTHDPDTIVSLLRRHRHWFGLDHDSHQRAIVLTHHLCQQAHQHGHQMIMSTKAGKPRLWLQVGLHRRTITITTAAAIASRLHRHDPLSPAAYPSDLLAVVASHDRWHHQAWTEDDRSLAAQAADIIRHITTSIEVNEIVADELAKMQPRR